MWGKKNKKNKQMSGLWVSADFEQCSDLLGFVVAKDREVVLLSLLWFVFSVPGSSHKAPGLPWNLLFSTSLRGLLCPAVNKIERV